VTVVGILQPLMKAVRERGTLRERDQLQPEPIQV
jgi:hypothetical protein